MAINITSYFSDFVDDIKKGNCNGLKFGRVEDFLYNEYALQFEFGCYLRNKVKNCIVQFEKNIALYNLNKKDFCKKEIDLVVEEKDAQGNIWRCVIEFKCPRKGCGETTENMYGMLKDIQFTEELKATKTKQFDVAYCIAVTDDGAFYDSTRSTSGKNSELYNIFRQGNEIHGTVTRTIKKKNGTQQQKVYKVKGKYSVQWQLIKNDFKYYLLDIK